MLISVSYITVSVSNLKIADHISFFIKANERLDEQQLVEDWEERCD